MFYKWCKPGTKAKSGGTKPNLRALILEIQSDLQGGKEGINKSNVKGT